MLIRCCNILTSVSESERMSNSNAHRDRFIDTSFLSSHIESDPIWDTQK